MPNSTDSRNLSTLSQQGYPKLVRLVLQNLWVIPHQQQSPGKGAFRVLHADNWLWFLKLSFWCGSNLGWLLGVTKADCYNRQVGPCNPEHHQHTCLTMALAKRRSSPWQLRALGPHWGHFGEDMGSRFANRWHEKVSQTRERSSRSWGWK